MHGSGLGVQGSSMKKSSRLFGIGGIANSLHTSEQLPQQLQNSSEAPVTFRHISSDNQMPNSESHSHVHLQALFGPTSAQGFVGPLDLHVVYLLSLVGLVGGDTLGFSQ